MDIFTHFSALFSIAFAHFSEVFSNYFTHFPEASKKTAIKLPILPYHE